MIKLPESLSAWATPQFNAVLKRELEALPVEQLPLQQGLTVGSYVLDERPSVMIFAVTEGGDLIRARIGVLYSGIIAGCSCADDPTPVAAVNEYCELWLTLDKLTGEGEVALAD
jgi:hypothetical protein